MPGRPKKERKRQDGEKKKPTRGRLSKKGTVIRCRLCKGIGHNRSSCSRRTGYGDQSAGASQPSRGAASGSAQASRGAARDAGSHSQAQSVAASHSQKPSGGAQSKRKSCPSSTTGSTKKQSSQLTVGSNDGQQGMHSPDRVMTTLRDGAQAKFTLEATAPGLSGKHSKATVHISGPSTSKVIVSATGAQKRKPSRERGPNAKSATTSTMLLQGPSSNV